MSHVGCAEFLAQCRVPLEQGLRHRCEPAEAVFPQGPWRKREISHAGDCSRDAQPERPGQAGDGVPEPSQQRRVGGVAAAFWQERRQQESCRESGHGQARDREHGELRQPADAREQESKICDTGARHTSREGGPQRAHAGPGIETTMLVTEQVYRIVLRDADQGEPEGERDAVHLAEDRADRREAGHPGAQQRQQAQQENGNAAIGHEQQDHDADHVYRADPLDLVPRPLLHQHRKRSGPACLQAQAGFGSRSLKGPLKRIGCLALPLRIETGCPGFRHEQRLVAGLVEPDVVKQLWLAFRHPRVGESQQFKRRITRQPRLEERRCRGRQVADPLLELRVKELGIQCRVVQRGRQQVAVREQPVRDCVQARFAVCDQPELAALAQPGGKRSGRVGCALGRSAGNREQQHAGCGSLADLLEDQSLLLRPRRGHEQAQVASDDEAAVHDPSEDRYDCDPGDQQKAPADGRHRISPADPLHTMTRVPRDLEATVGRRGSRPRAPSRCRRHRVRAS